MNHNVIVLGSSYKSVARVIAEKLCSFVTKMELDTQLEFLTKLQFVSNFLSTWIPIVSLEGADSPLKSRYRCGVIDKHYSGSYRMYKILKNKFAT